MVFSTGTFLGASPELLISRLGRRVRSHPLAGTVARSGDPAADAALTGLLLGSAKEREEHRLVVDEVAAALRPVCRALDVPEVPSIVALRNVSHLGTLIEGELEGDEVTALDLVSRLHPTPAVAGSPTAPAVAYLTDVEGFDRGCYAGPVGWMDSRGDGEWAVAVRSAEVRGNTARLFAGVGVVSDSDPGIGTGGDPVKLKRSWRRRPAWRRRTTGAVARRAGPWHDRRADRRGGRSGPHRHLARRTMAVLWCLSVTSVPGRIPDEPTTDHRTVAWTTS